MNSIKRNNNLRAGLLFLSLVLAIVSIFCFFFAPLYSYATSYMNDNFKEAESIFNIVFLNRIIRDADFLYKDDDFIFGIISFSLVVLGLLFEFIGIIFFGVKAGRPGKVMSYLAMLCLICGSLLSFTLYDRMISGSLFPPGFSVFRTRSEAGSYLPGVFSLISSAVIAPVFIRTKAA